MNKKFAAAALAFAALSASAHAQLFRAYVSKDGNDANPCTLQQPCRLLPAALAAMADGGEIWMLDSANFNTTTVEIMKSVSILAVPGAVGSVVANNATAISIAAAGLKVSLRNIVVVPLPGTSGATVHGVSMTAASALTVEKSLFSGLPGNAVYATGAGRVHIVDTTMKDGSSYAVELANGISGQISGSRILGNAAGGILASVTEGTLQTSVHVSDTTLVGVGSLQSSTITDRAVHALVTGGTSQQYGAAHVRVDVSRSTIHGFGFGITVQKTAGYGYPYAYVSGTHFSNLNLLTANSNGSIMSGGGNSAHNYFNAGPGFSSYGAF